MWQLESAILPTQTQLNPKNALHGFEEEKMRKRKKKIATSVLNVELPVVLASVTSAILPNTRVGGWSSLQPRRVPLQLQHYAYEHKM